MMAAQRRTKSAKAPVVERAEQWGVKEAAYFLGMSEDWVYSRAAEGKIPAFKLGKRWRFHPTALKSWHAQQGQLKG